MLGEGMDASRHNVGKNPPGVGGEKYAGADYYTPEPRENQAAQNEVPPPSAIETAEGRKR